MLDYSEDLPPDLPAPKPRGQGRFMAAGVVSALALGAGMGLWARPAPPETPRPATMAPEDAPRPALQIVVDENPAPLGPLLEVLPGEASQFRDAPPPPEIVAPHRAAAGLMKVDAVVAAEPPLLVPAVKVEPKPEPRVEKAPEKPKVQKAKAEPRPEKPKVVAAKAKKAEAAKIETARLEKARLEKAKVEKARAEKARLAQVEKAKAEKLAKAEKAKAVKLAQAEARREKAAKAKAETRRLAALVKAAPKKLKAEVSKKKTQLAQAKPAKKAVAAKPKVEKASTKPVIAKAPVRKPPPRRVAPVGEGPMRVARYDAWDARDRQLQQAYRNAEAAGVPASSLQRQQARWLQARAAAAREAPWAVEDVYEARISELNDLTRDAREN